MKHFVTILAFLIYASNCFGQQPIENCGSVSLDKMNFLYVDVDNPVTIAINSNFQVNVSVDNGEIRGGRNFYLIHPTVVGNLAVTIQFENGRKNKYFYSVRELPKPIIANIKSSFQQSDLIRLKMLEVISNEPHFDINYKIDSFSIIKISKKGNIIITNHGADFSVEAKSVFSSCEIGDKLLFTNIQCTYLLKRKILSHDLLVDIE